MRKSTSWDFPSARILVIDDNLSNCEVVQELLVVGGYSYIDVLNDSRQAVDRIVKEAPDLVLLDLHMPHVTGYEVLAQLSQRMGPDAFIPILVFTADSTSSARKRALDLGANDFITKPVDNVELILRVRNFLRMRHMHLAMYDENAALEARVKTRTQELIFSREEGVECLARALEYRDDATGEHTKRVGAMSTEIARALGLSEYQIDLIRLGSPLHDLGKICVPDALLLKPGWHTPEEFEAMKRHTTLGGTIMSKCQTPLMSAIREIVLHHHERWDGAGYPDGLKGEEIPISCRIVAVADVFDALTHDRPYKHAWTRQEAIEEICRQRGTQFDPTVVDVFLDLYANEFAVPG